MNTVKTDRVTRRSRSVHECEEQSYRHEKVPTGVGNQPIFFFQGDFRTWTQVEARAQLQMALAAQAGSFSLRQLLS